MTGRASLERANTDCGDYSSALAKFEPPTIPSRETIPFRCTRTFRTRRRRADRERIMEKELSGEMSLDIFLLRERE